MLYSCPKVFMHLTTDGTQLISGREIFQTASQWVWVYRHLLKILSFPLGSCSDVWLLDHQGVVLVILGGLSMKFPTMAVVVNAHRHQQLTGVLFSSSPRQCFLPLVCLVKAFLRSGGTSPLRFRFVLQPVMIALIYSSSIQEAEARESEVKASICHKIDLVSRGGRQGRVLL